MNVEYRFLESRVALAISMRHTTKEKRPTIRKRGTGEDRKRTAVAAYTTSLHPNPHFLSLPAAPIGPIYPPPKQAPAAPASGVLHLRFVGMEVAVRPVGHPGDYFEFVRSFAIAVLDSMM